MGEHGVSLENIGNMENMENMEKMENINQMTQKSPEDFWGRKASLRFYQWQIFYIVFKEIAQSGKK